MINKTINIQPRIETNFPIFFLFLIFIIIAEANMIPRMINKTELGELEITSNKI